MFVNYCNKESQATQVGSQGIYSTGLSKAKLRTNVGNKDNIISSIPYIKGLYSYQLYEVSTLNSD